MKIIKKLSLIILLFITACKTVMVFESSIDLDDILLLMRGNVYINGPYFEKYIKSFDGCETTGSVEQHLILNYFHKDLSEYRVIKEYDTRWGQTIKAQQVGYWKTESYKLRREEYFKMGLRDSIYRIYNTKGDTIYSTYFNMGTGIEKDYHENGQLYYEIELKDGYFTDTLRIYDKQGRIAEKLYFEKDSLVYYKSFSYPE